MKDEVASAQNEGLLSTCKLAPDIEESYKLKKREDKPNTLATRTSIIFKEKSNETEILKVKSKLQGKDMWILDDLTPFRSNLTYLAWQAVKGNVTEQMWVHDGTVFIKMKCQKRPLKVTTSDDIPK